MTTPAPWKIEVSPTHNGHLWAAWYWDRAEYVLEASEIAETPQEAFGDACDALQARLLVEAV